MDISLKEKVKDKIKARTRSRKDLALELGVSLSSINNIMKDRSVSEMMIHYINNRLE